MTGGHHGGHDGAAGGPGMGPMAFGRPGDAAAADRTVTVIMDDNFFEPAAIAVRSGETVRFAVENRGTLVHEFNLGTPAYHRQHQDEMMMMQQRGVLTADRIDREKMMMPMGGDGHMMTHDHPNSVLLEPGGSGEVVWTFAAAAADTRIEFACNVPGHYAAGMAGEVEVEGE